MIGDIAILTKKIMNIFIQSFDVNIITKNFEECKIIAKMIIEAM